MSIDELKKTAKALTADDKGLLAMDESNPTCNKRFAKLGIPQTEESRRDYRELIVTTPRLNESISGAILYDETVRQQKRDGTSFVKALTDVGIIPGIKVDKGAKDLPEFPGEKVTEGLDGLRQRLAEYKEMGLRFAKWRAVIAIGHNIPTSGCIEANAHALARYAALCQEAGLVPIVEPEVLMDGNHTMRRCEEVTEEVLQTVFQQLYRQRVALEGILLKPNMVLPGLECPKQESVEEVADATVNCFLRAVPGHRVSFRRSIGRAGLGTFERDEHSLQGAHAVGAGLLVLARNSTTGFGNLAGRGSECVRCAAGSCSSGRVQPSGTSR